METQVIPVHPEHPEPAAIGKAVDVLRRGGLVAFPTETVYGLGANALDPEAVQGIFNAKGRPARNPVIVHVHDAEGVHTIAQSWPAEAALLAEKFWPGPITLVLPKRANVPATVTGGGPTVAVRVPAHPVAQALLRAVELPVAAPSANRSSRLSPTEAQHVLRDLGGLIPLILDGGPTPRGLESTVIDLSGPVPRLLRPGIITREAVETVLNRTLEVGVRPTEQALPSPGMLDRHYSPYTPLELAESNDCGRARVEELTRAGHRVGWVPLSRSGPDAPTASVIVMPLLPDPVSYSQRFYATLHALDVLRPERIVVTLPPDKPEWLAVRDRLLRAATPRNARPCP